MAKLVFNYLKIYCSVCTKQIHNISDDIVLVFFIISSSLTITLTPIESVTKDILCGFLVAWLPACRGAGPAAPAPAVAA